MLKQSIYPKTQRLPLAPTIQITEKVDGSNLVLFSANGKLWVAQRNSMFKLEDIKNKTIKSDSLYRGLYQFLMDHGDDLEKDIYEGSAICGEWLGMGKLKYDNAFAPHRFLMFGKARIDDQDSPTTLSRLVYTRDVLGYAFNEGVIPSYIGVVPLVEVAHSYEALTLPYLDALYERYTEKVGRPVEGFVIQYAGGILKYVRMKNGKIEPHFDRGEE